MSREFRAVSTVERLSGRVRLPPSKSLSNRALNLALLSDTRTEINGLLESEDTAALVSALVAAGRPVECAEDGVFRVGPRERVSGAEIFCGASGTMLRFLTASLAVVPGDWTLDGTRRLRERPLGPLIDALRMLGADIECLGEDGFAPLRISGRDDLRGRTTVDAGESSQFLSALLMASARASSRVSIEVAGLTSAPYVDLTLQTMKDFGLRVDREAGIFTVDPRPIEDRRIEIEADYSSACYFGAAAALTGSRLSLCGLRPDSMQGDRKFFDVLEAMGASCRWRDGRLEVQGPERLAGLSRDFSGTPDQVPTLAAIAPFAEGGCRVTGVAHLRLKESDRLAVVARELRRAGVGGVEVGEDSLEVPGVWFGREAPSTEVLIETADDHRIAMAFAVLGLRRKGVSIESPRVVAKSYPGFWNAFEAVISGS